ncbi:MAG: class I SAM-dependent methyltransferase [Desulfatibacillum sp.]|nr:class I SAM-dependent methyltransferase [Desulfatibacillum sp.]
MTRMDRDWNLVWKEQMEKHRASDGGRDCVDFWAKASTAKIYEKSARTTQGPRIARMMEDITSNNHKRVLDIGAGPGILSIPLAKKVEHVTAVEPAKGMIDRLREEMTAQNVQNLSCVEKRWEDVDLMQDLQGPYDAVVCSFALGMDDIRAALEKMAAASSSRVYLYWFAGDSSWNVHYKELYPMLHDRQYESMPDSSVLMGVLEQMGVIFEASPFSYSSQSDFANLPEAVGFYRYRYNVKTPEHESLLSEYLDKTLRKENGKRVLDIHAKCMGISFSV